MLNEILCLLRNGYILVCMKYLSIKLFMEMDNIFLNLEAEPEKLVKPIFILGAQRSGTTALHESIFLSSPGLRSLTFFETMVRSEFLRKLFRPLANLILNGYTTKGHRFDPYALSEEHLLLPRVILFLVPELLSCLPEKRIAEYLQVSNQDMAYIRKVISRGKGQYIGKPLDLTMNISQLKETFPDARFLVCRRNRNDSYKSYVTLLYNIYHPNERLFQNICAFGSKYVIGGIYRAMENIDETLHSSTSIVINFENWCEDSSGVLEKIEKEFNLLMPEKIIYGDGKSDCLPENYAVIADNAIKNSFSTEFVHPIITMVRLPYHVNFAIIIVGYLACNAVEKVDVALLFKTYFTFCWLLYTGLYCFNGYQDYEEDIDKPWRHVWTKMQYLIAAVGFISTAIVVTRRILPELLEIFLSFVAINVGYSITKKYYGSLYLEAAVSAATAPLRLHLGAQLRGCNRLSFFKYFATWVGMISIHIVRKKKLKNATFHCITHFVISVFGLMIEKDYFFWLLTMFSNTVILGNVFGVFYSMYV
jgi:hypothetical protein